MAAMCSAAIDTAISAEVLAQMAKSYRGMYTGVLGPGEFEFIRNRHTTHVAGRQTNISNTITQFGTK